jgi:hypothetical protein
VDVGLGGAQLRTQRRLGGFADAGFPLGVGALFLQPLDVVGLAQGFGAEGAEGGGEGFAVFGIALEVRKEAS